MRSRLPVVAAAALILAGALAIGIPFLTKNRDYPASIPSPHPLFRVDQVPLQAGGEACFDKAVIEQHSAEARFTAIAPAGTKGPPLRLTLTGPGYVHTASVPGGYSGSAEQYALVPRPAHSIPLRVCIQNRGQAPVGLLAATDRTRSRSLAVVDGHPMNASVVFGFWEKGIVDVRRRLPDIATRATIFRPAYVGSWWVWAVGLLMLLGIPALVLAAAARATRESAPGSEAPGTDRSVPKT